jgi:hypothetical protein
MVLMEGTISREEESQRKLGRKERFFNKRGQPFFLPYRTILEGEH